MRDIGLEVSTFVKGHTYGETKDQKYNQTKFIFNCETKEEMSETYDDIIRSIMNSPTRLFAFTEVKMGVTIDTCPREIYKATAAGMHDDGIGNYHVYLFGEERTGFKKENS